MENQQQNEEFKKQAEVEKESSGDFEIQKGDKSKQKIEENKSIKENLIQGETEVKSKITIEQLWREIIALGTAVMIIGGILLIVGLIVGIAIRTWITFFIGIIVLSIGIVTEAFPYIHLSLRVRKFEKMLPHLIQEWKEQSKMEEQKKEDK